MIELYYWPTPNGHKITMFLAFSPNNRMPAIIDTFASNKTWTSFRTCAAGSTPYANGRQR